jgi:hypothetical protein
MNREGMTDKSNRKELEQGLAQARRLAKEAVDTLTKDRLAALIRDIEEQLGRHNSAPAWVNFT